MVGRGHTMGRAFPSVGPKGTVDLLQTCGSHRKEEMLSVHCQSSSDDEARRERIYQGDIFLFAPRASTLALSDFARGFLEEAFHPLDPLHARGTSPPEAYADLVAPVKPAFIHCPTTKTLIRELLEDFGCDG